MTANAEIIAELRRVLNERDEARARVIDAALIHAELVRERDEALGKLEAVCDRHVECWPREYYQSAVRERDEARAEVERLRAEAAPMNEHFNAGYRDGYRDAYRRGAEAMRERCAMEVRGKFLGTNSDLPRIEVAVRIEAALLALPIPGEP